MELVVREDGVEDDAFKLTGIGLPGKGEENLVITALKRLRESFKFEFLKIHLHKVIPPGAGLGGGSSDAACMLCTLNRYFELSMDKEDLKTIAAGIGSDCAFFIESRPVFATGRGEIMEPVDPVLDGFQILLLNPGIKISTKEAYGDCIPSGRQMNLKGLIGRRVSEWKDLMINDFEKTIFRKFPEIGSLKERLYKSGALYCSMSGSGATLFGIYHGKPDVPDDLKGHVIYSGEL